MSSASMTMCDTDDCTSSSTIHSFEQTGTNNTLKNVELGVKTKTRVLHQAIDQMEKMALAMNKTIVNCNMLKMEIQELEKKHAKDVLLWNRHYDLFRAANALQVKDWSIQGVNNAYQSKVHRSLNSVKPSDTDDASHDTLDRYRCLLIRYLVEWKQKHGSCSCYHSNKTMIQQLHRFTTRSFCTTDDTVTSSDTNCLINDTKQQEEEEDHLVLSRVAFWDSTLDSLYRMFCLRKQLRCMTDYLHKCQALYIRLAEQCNQQLQSLMPLTKR